MNQLQTILVSVSLSVALTTFMLSGYSLPNLFVWKQDETDKTDKTDKIVETIEHVPAEETNQIVEDTESTKNELKPYEIYA